MKKYRVIGDASYFNPGELVIENRYTIFDNIRAYSSEEAIIIACRKGNIENYGQFTAVEIIEGYSLDIPTEEGYYFLYGVNRNTSKIIAEHIVYCGVKIYETDAREYMVCFPNKYPAVFQNDLTEYIRRRDIIWYFDKNRIEIKEMKI